MQNTFVHSPQSIEAISQKQVVVFEVWKSLLSDQSEVFGIYFNGEEIYPANSQIDVHDRCSALNIKAKEAL